MKTTQKTDTVLFSIKGQMVIPRWLRREYQIEEGTRAVVYPEAVAAGVKIPENAGLIVPI